MSNFDRAVKALNDVDEAIDHLADNEAYVTALEAAGLLMPDLQIIRTVKELEGLDPDAVTVDNEETVENANMWLDDSGKTYPYDERFLPAAALATGAQFRAALEAMERDDD